MKATSTQPFDPLWALFSHAAADKSKIPSLGVPEPAFAGPEDLDHMACAANWLPIDLAVGMG
jgi:hypothetical protein